MASTMVSSTMQPVAQRIMIGRVELTSWPRAASVIGNPCVGRGSVAVAADEMTAGAVGVDG